MKMTRSQTAILESLVKREVEQQLKIRESQLKTVTEGFASDEVEAITELVNTIIDDAVDSLVQNFAGLIDDMITDAIWGSINSVSPAKISKSEVVDLRQTADGNFNDQDDINQFLTMILGDKLLRKSKLHAQRMIENLTTNIDEGE